MNWARLFALYPTEKWTAHWRNNIENDVNWCKNEDKEKAVLFYIFSLLLMGTALLKSHVMCLTDLLIIICLLNWEFISYRQCLFSLTWFSSDVKPVSHKHCLVKWLYCPEVLLWLKWKRKGPTQYLCGEWKGNVLVSMQNLSKSPCSWPLYDHL